jgi:Spy/CpxP family protein refolding chaperone
MKKWQVAILTVFFVSLGTAVFALSPPFGDGIPPFAGNAGFRPPFARVDGFPGPTTPLGFGQIQPPFGPGFQGGFGPDRYLNLSEEQSSKMAALRDRYLQDTRDLRYALAQQQLEVRRVITDPKTDDATLLAKEKEMSTLRQQLFNKMEQMPLEMRKILTPEQIRKLDRMPVGGFGVGFGRMGFGAPGPGR